MKKSYSTDILASYVTFKELYNANRYRSPYQILSEFIRYIIYTEKLYSFSLLDIKTYLNKMFGFNLPTAVIKTSLKVIDGLDRVESKTGYIVRPNTVGEDSNFTLLQNESEKCQKKLEAILIQFAEEHSQNQFLDVDILLQDFIVYLIDENSNTKNHDLISEFILYYEQDNFVRENIEAIRQGSILYIGLNYNISETGSLKKDLTLYLDIEILFDLMGFNGEIYQSLANDFIKLVNDANKGKHKIKLRYFTDIKKEIENFFEVAKSIIEGKVQYINKPAMKFILNGCQGTTDVFDKMADFFCKLRTQYAIFEDENTLYYSKANYEYNLEGMNLDDLANDAETSEALKYVSNINKLRKGETFKEYTEAEYLFITETGRALDVSTAVMKNINKDNMDNKCGFALNMCTITNILWYKLNKGFGRKDYPKSLDAVLKAKIVLTRHISRNITTTYIDLKRKCEEGEISKEQMAMRLIVLREKIDKPDDISIDTLKDQLDFSPDFFDKFTKSIEQDRMLLQEKDKLMEKMKAKAEFEQKQADQKIIKLEERIESSNEEKKKLQNKVARQDREILEFKNRELAREKQNRIRKNWIEFIIKAIFIILVYVVFLYVIYFICNYFKFDFGVGLTLLGFVGIKPIFNILKNNYPQ